MGNLFDEAEFGAFTNGDLAFVRFDAANEDFEQRGFARTVGADQTDALAFGDGEGNIFEERREAVTFR